MDFTSHSRSVRAIKYIEQLYQLSLTHSFMTRLGGVIKNSRVFSFFSKLVERDSSAATSLTFKALEYLCDKARKPAGLLKSAYENSFIYRFVTGTLKPDNALIRFPNISYIVALYVFIDYILRDVLQLSAYAGYWDELILVAAAGIWLVKLIANGGDYIDRRTPLDIPLAFFFIVGLFLLIVNSPDLGISIEGLRAVAQYMLWFFLVIRLVDSKRTAKNVYTILVLSGTVLAIHGILQYIIGVEMPASWLDLAEAGVRTRAFSIIGSPNILGSMMLLLSPMALSLFYAEKDLLRKVFFLGSSFAMGLCLIFTLSRGAWLGMAAVAVVFILQKDKRLFVPLIVVALLAFLLVPSVGDRISYMLSDKYVASSFRGGRLGRWTEGFEMFKNNLLFGVGLGHFGGAVAKNNNIPGTFYMDNYYLKTAVEMGITGLLAFLVLVYNVIIWCYRKTRKITDSFSIHLSQGAFAGLCGVLVHNLVENVFEEPMMSTYFWIITALVFIMAREKEPAA